MKSILAILLIFTSFASFAKRSEKIENYHQAINKELGLERNYSNHRFDCYPNYEEYRKKLLKKSLLVGGLGILAVPVSYVVGLVLGSYTASALGAGIGTSVIASSTTGAILGGGVLVGLTAYEVSLIVKYIKATRMQKLIAESKYRIRRGEMEQKFLLKAIDEDPSVTLNEVKTTIKFLNNQKSLCNGDLNPRHEKLMAKGKTKRANKLKNMLAMPKHVRSYMFQK
jgi:hypothetical protein